MKYTFSIMSQESALMIANQWHYEEPYSFYDAEADRDDYQELISPELRNSHYYEAKIEDDLVGFFSITIDDGQIEIGLGLRPDYCGKGLGKEFLCQIEEYLIPIFHPQKLIVFVASFNLRAMKVYKSCGYQIIGEENRRTNNDNYLFIKMEKEVYH
ncbi:MAG: GNAT family N-acetyltransferase [Bacilli bacterium]|nr:GNAT family N-acetyltransferase [Bacilli bacterium]MDY0209301.1 GNAT family N-acetyltransferase [Bacilli bacterium]